MQREHPPTSELLGKSPSVYTLASAADMTSKGPLLTLAPQGAMEVSSDPSGPGTELTPKALSMVVIHSKLCAVTILTMQGLAASFLKKHGVFGVQ